MTHFNAIVAALVLSIAGSSTPYTVQTSPSTVTVMPAGGWHLNEDYPWRIVTSDSKQRGFVLKWNSATATGLTKGPATLRGGVCNANTCVSITRIVVIP